MYRFTIRDVLWLTLVAGMALGWWMEYRRFTPEDRELLRTARTMGLEMELDKRRAASTLNRP
jgi:hypothetical protein